MTDPDLRGAPETSRDEAATLSDQVRELRAQAAQLRCERDEARAWAQAQANGLFRGWQLDGTEPEWLAELPPVEPPAPAAGETDDR